MTTEARIFLGIGAFLVLASVLYGVTSEEWAGTTMLLLAGSFGLATGGYLTVAAARTPAVADEGAPADEGQGPDLGDAYLPHASVWPFALGLGAVVVANGFALGLWALVPGVILTTLALVGYARQSRRRD